MELEKTKKIHKSQNDIAAKYESRKRFITPKSAAQTFGFCEGTLANLRSKKLGCKYYKVNRKILYDFSEFESWIKRNPVMTMDSVAQENEQSRYGRDEI